MQFSYMIISYLGRDMWRDASLDPIHSESSMLGTWSDGIVLKKICQMI